MSTAADLTDVCVVVPMYNEATVLGGVLANLMDTFPFVLCVDDGSSDGSAEIARAAGATVLRHAVNLGQGAALQTGFDFALNRDRFSHVVTFDADGQHDPSDARAMVVAARETGVDVVLGTRAMEGTIDQPLSRRMILKAALRYSRWSSGLELTDTHNGLRVLSRGALANVRLTQRGMAYASELESLIAARSLSWTEHPITVTYTDYSRSKGQHNLNAVNIMYDLMSVRLRTPA